MQNGIAFEVRDEEVGKEMLRNLACTFQVHHNQRHSTDRQQASCRKQRYEAAVGSQCLDQ